MLLSTQLTRAALSLPLLLAFAMLALLAESPEQAGPGLSAPIALAQQICRMPGQRANVLVLAQAPADLGTLAIRWQVPCRA